MTSLRSSALLIAMVAAASTGCGNEGAPAGEAMPNPASTAIAETGPAHDTGEHTETPADGNGTAHATETDSGHEATTEDADQGAAAGEADRMPTIHLGEGAEFAMVPKVTKVPAGRVDFAVANLGSIEHEVIFIRTDADSGDLPPDSRGGAAEDGAVTPRGSGHGDGSGAAHVGTHFHAGGEGTLSIDLAPGRYAVICNLPGHYAAGMHANIEVS